MENEKYLHGRLDPGIESNVQLVEAVESPDMSNFFSSQEASSSESSQIKNTAFPGMYLSTLYCICLVFLASELCFFA